ncbi:MAG: hypothetical protein F4X04_01085 [Holophagales bacterium]|nr:hypothetical protein [Holophagales bacterium]
MVARVRRRRRSRHRRPSGHHRSRLLRRGGAARGRRGRPVVTTLLQRIEPFIVAGDGAFDGEFVELAAAAARFGYERVEPYRRLCDRRGVDPAALDDWRAAPAVPTSAFKSLRLAAAEPREVFRSSGTTRGAERRSVHYHPYPGLYRTVIDASFADACLPAGAERLPTLSLIPDRAIAPDSSLSFMAAHVFERHAAPGSAWAVQDAGIDLHLACRWLRAQAEGEPVLVLATALALVLLLDRLESEAGGPIRLPPGSRVFETGGFKGRSLETTPEAVRRRNRTLLGLDPDAVVREYGMTELTSQAYSRPGGERLHTPPWMPFRVLDPESLEEVEDGETGLLAFFDLANVGSVCHVLTEDLGVREGAAFRLLGRARGAELRGCSLTAEELGAV